MKLDAKFGLHQAIGYLTNELAACEAAFRAADDAATTAQDEARRLNEVFLVRSKALEHAQKALAALEGKP